MSTPTIHDILPLSSWWPGTDKPLLISGPCSVETEEQLTATAQQLAAIGKVQVLRGGLWKPRTRPDTFEGVGATGIPWMLKARELTGLPITTEVATAEHVELCLKNNFDMLWVGARTVANPFSVQEIADALRGTDIPVIVKNPINADLQLWIGAMERFQRAGINKIIALHRGFSHNAKSIYRNQPMWELPIALKTQFPRLPVFCDPSHICGQRDLLQAVAQKALDLGMEGLMLESHITPNEAWSDANQQITPARLNELIEALHVRTATTTDTLFSNELQALRASIDKIDEEIIQLISSRMQLSAEVGRYKKKHNITILQVERWKEIMDTRSMLAANLGLSADFITKYLEQIHKESIRTQTWVMNETGAKSKTL